MRSHRESTSVFLNGSSLLKSRRPKDFEAALRSPQSSTAEPIVCRLRRLFDHLVVVLGHVATRVLYPTRPYRHRGGS